MTTPLPYGILRALSSSIGEEDNLIGGMFLTRLTSALQTGTPLATTLNWNGTLTVATTDTSELVQGDWIRLDTDGRYFEITGIIPNVECQIANPVGYPVPTGTSQSSKAIQTFPVESTIDWQDDGKFSVDGVVYHYTSKTWTTFDGVYHVVGGDNIPGPYRQHRVDSAVLDLNRNRNALDQVRRAMLVEYAAGEDLNAIGRNIGVFRLPFLAGDERFRSIVKALSYNPRGTMLGLELALAGLVGEGNFEIYEDLIRYPCKVFIRLKGAAATDARSQGKAFLSGPEWLLPVAANQVNTDKAFITRGTLHGIFWKDEELLTDTRTAYPSAHFVREFPTDILRQAWRYSGGTEGVQVKLQNGGVQFDLAAGDARYKRQLRVTDNADLSVEVVAKSVAAGGSETWPCTVLSLEDGVRGMAIVFRWLGGGNLQVGLSRYFNGSLGVPVATATVSSNTWYTLKLVKVRRQRWEVWIDGVRRLTAVYGTDDVASSERRVTLGVVSGLTSADMVVKQIQLKSRDITDLSSLWGRTATRVSANQIDIGLADFVAGDVGRHFLISEAVAANPQGGNNNGLYQIVSVDSGSQVTLDGIPGPNAVVDSVNPTRVVIPTSGRLFQFPDDLGKTLEISGSTLGNNGTWVITSMLDPGTLTPLEGWSTWIPTKTNVVELTGPSFVPETGLTWQVHPAFVAESGMRYDMPGAASIVGQTITTRRPFPTFTDANFVRVLGTVYSQVLSSQVLLDANVDNYIIQEVPDLWFKYYPFYLADPLGFVRIYLSDVTAAGVIPDYLIV
jgi:hypothetical protein